MHPTMGFLFQENNIGRSSYVLMLLNAAFRHQNLKAEIFLANPRTLELSQLQMGRKKQALG